MLGVFFSLLAWRLRVRTVIDAIRRFDKEIFNPAIMHFAGCPHWDASVLYHKGRRSGRRYATPPRITPIDGGFVVALAYGERVDWLKNVLAEGVARIETKGETYVVETGGGRHLGGATITSGWLVGGDALYTHHLRGRSVLEVEASLVGTNTCARATRRGGLLGNSCPCG